MFLIEQEYPWEAPFSLTETADAVMEALWEQEGVPFSAEVDLVLSGEEEIRRVNREFRGVDAVTDVLSFPSLDISTPADFEAVLRQPQLFENPDTGKIILGDMMICVPRMLAQAEEYGHGVKREYAFLIAHSLLHLLGYDHMEEAEAVVMEAKQEQVLTGLNITR